MSLNQSQTLKSSLPLARLDFPIQSPQLSLQYSNYSYIVVINILVLPPIVWHNFDEETMYVILNCIIQ